MKFFTKFKIAINLLLIFLLFSANATYAATIIVLDSEPGDFVGAGQLIIRDTTDGTFTTMRANSSHVNIRMSGTGTFWGLDFEAIEGQELVPGTYLNATRYPFNPTNVNGLSVSGDGRGCNQLSGQFTVLEAVYNSSDGSVQSFAADFEQHCENAIPALFGQVRFNSNVPLSINVDYDLSISNLASKENYLVGEDIIYTIDVSNLHTTVARDVTVTDSLPSGLNFISVTPSIGNCTGGINITCSLGDLNPGVSASINLVTRAQSTGNFFNTVSVSASGINLNDSNDNFTEVVTVNPLPLTENLYPLTERNHWTYLQDGGLNYTETVTDVGVTFNGQTTVSVLDSDGDTTYYSNDQNGLLEHGFKDNSGDIATLTPPVKILNAQPQIGDIINSGGTAQFNLSSQGLGTFDFLYTATSEVLGVEQVSVPFGSLIAVKVQLTAMISGNVQGIPFNESSIDTIWFVEDVGYVKNIVNDQDDFSTTTFELFSFETLPPPPTITSPTDGSTFTGSSVTFMWDAMGTPVSEWWINLGSTLGGRDIHVSGSLGSATSVTINNIPVDGSTVYARLWYRNGGGAWQSQDFTYTAFTGPPPQLPTITSPTDGSTFTGSSVTFMWDAMGTPVSEWWINLGSTLGGRDIHVSGSLGSATSVTINNIPVDGSTVYARLWYRNGGGSWQSQDFTYTAFTGPPPQLPTITSPTDGSTFTGSSVTFMWDAMGTPVSEWWINLGSTLGGRDIHVSGSLGSATSVTINNIPVDGSTVYARLWYRNGGGAWQSQDFTYTAFTGPPPQLPTITSPTDGSTFTGSSVTFMWDAMGAPVSEWWINLGSTLGGRDIHVSGSLGSATSVTINNIPVDGSTVYARLWYRNGGGAWQSQDFTYTAFTGPPPQLPTITSPTDGSTFTGSSVTFMWDAMGTPVSEWWINLGSTLGGRDIHVSGSLGSATSVTINNIPVDGSTVYARLWYRNGGGAWQSQDFTYTAFTGPPPQLPTITSPTDGSTFTGSSVTFMWDAMGTPVSEWWINLGSTLGGRDIHVSGSLGSATSVTINNIPVDGSTVYARLWYRNGGGSWQSQDFTYTAATIFVGVYSMSGTNVDSGCQDPSDNGVTTLAGSFSIPSQSSNAFVGTFDVETLDGIVLSQTGISITGTFNSNYTSATNISGTYVFEANEGVNLLARNEGTFTANLIGNQFSISYSGMDTVGDVCQSTGGLSGRT